MNLGEGVKFLALKLYASRACPVRRALCMRRARAKKHGPVMPNASRALCASRATCMRRVHYHFDFHGFENKFSPFNSPIRPLLWEFVKMTCPPWFI